MLPKFPLEVSKSLDTFRNASDEICGVSILSKLNELGQDRWELVSYAYASEVQGGFIFKRQVMP